MNICVVGYGMMGGWHSDALAGGEARLHTLVGRRPEAAADFAHRYGYARWTTHLEEALADPAVDAVILANPSDQHAETALAALGHGKPTLVEIPLAMRLADADRIVAAAAERNLTLGVVHPLRLRPELSALRERVAAGEEHLRHVSGRFFIHRLENVGATGYRRSWTDNLLWHHTTHLLDAGLWLLGEPVRAVHSLMPPPDARTGIPMEVCLSLETTRDQSLVCTGSYYGHERIMELFAVTDRESYRLDVFRSTLTTGAGAKAVDAEKDICMRVTRDFVAAVQDGRPPAVPGAAVLPAMRVLQQAQDQWDAVHGARPIPGRGLVEGDV